MLVCFNFEVLLVLDLGPCVLLLCLCRATLQSRTFLACIRTSITHGR
jgi:hypothetical protein